MVVLLAATEAGSGIDLHVRRVDLSLELTQKSFPFLFERSIFGGNGRRAVFSVHNLRRYPFARIAHGTGGQIGSIVGPALGTGQAISGLSSRAKRCHCCL